MRCPLCCSDQTQVHTQKNVPHLGPRLYWQCLGCGLFFLEPSHHLSAEAEKIRYDQHRNGPDQEGYVRFLSQLVEPMNQKLKPGLQGLDFGCGPGPTLEVLMRACGYDMAHYDPFYFPDRTVLQRTYDFVTCTEVIEHFSQPRKAFELLDQLLDPENGCLGVLTQVLEEEKRFSDWWYLKDPTHVSFYQPRTFKWIARWLGWTVEFPKKNVMIFFKIPKGVLCERHTAVTAGRKIFSR